MNNADADIKRKIRDICRHVLETETFQDDDHFFECGGDSIRASMVVTRIEQRFGIEFELLYLFENPTVEAISEQVRSKLSESQAGHRTKPVSFVSRL